MRTVTIQCGACVTVKVKRGEMPCPFCGTIVRAENKHSCTISETPGRRRPTRQPHKGAK
jgi:predicted RNA-binding Zn-ribbon protein involved in translation (DUF1610 family)